MPLRLRCNDAELDDDATVGRDVILHVATDAVATVADGNAVNVDNVIVELTVVDVTTLIVDCGIATPDAVVIDDDDDR